MGRGGGRPLDSELGDDFESFALECDSFCSRSPHFDGHMGYSGRA